MQAMPVTAAMPNGKAAQSAGSGNEGAAAEGVDFSALLMAQIRDGRGVEAEAEVLPDAEATESVLADVAAQPDPGSLPVGEAALDGGLLPPPGIFIPLQAAVAQQPGSPVLPAAASGKKLEGVVSGPNVIAQFDEERPRTSAASLEDSGRVADFAVNGKTLPLSGAEKNADSQNPPALSAESGRIPEIPGNAMPAAMAASHAPAAEAKPLTLPPATLQAPVGTTGWGDALGQKVVWMAGQQTQVAELHLNPPHLGPMEVRLSVSNDQVSALFVSHQPAVREAIEAAMPRLREMFADSGMTLGNATVSSDSLPQQQPSGHEGRPGSSRQPEFSAMGNMLPPLNMGGVISLRHDGSGMVDLFA
ncbi:MAG: hypothetical protein C3F18_05805 [Nitrosomonadales bacterium]|nr:MAG: hypothetical protein C3F18_05805 [Nitrosomonadales bacterium]